MEDFSTWHNKTDWAEVQSSIYAKTSQDVERALKKTKRSIEDFKALISPAAIDYVTPMANIAYHLTRQRFGKTMRMYIPLYLSNLCTNHCTYCGFASNKRIKRKVLTPEEIEKEIQVIKSKGFDHVLLVTGEHPRKVGMDYFRSVIPLIKKHFSYISMEVQPLECDEYKELKVLGVDAILVYQETYHREMYKKYHLRGKKMDFDFRLETPERVARAGMDKIGLGALIGLDDWRTDSFYVASHLTFLEKNYWRSRYSLSFPRIRPHSGTFEPKSVMSDKELVQLICAYRLLNPEVELSLSTRESAWLRDNLLPLGITAISAESKTQPGGYAGVDNELEQFAISDERKIDEVVRAVKVKQLQPVWKDWDLSYG